jgi:WD40 repeat protein
MEWLDEDTMASSGYWDGPIRLWSVSTGRTIREIKLSTNSARVSALKLLNNKIHFAVVVRFDINIYKISDGQLVSTLRGHTNFVNDLEQVSGTNLLISSSDDETIKVWDTAAQICKFNLYGHISSVVALKLINTEMLASYSFDSTIKLWNLTSALLIRTLNRYASDVLYSLDLTNNGQTLVSGTFEKDMEFWKWSTGELLSKTQTNSQIRSLAVVNGEQTTTTPTRPATDQMSILFFNFPDL